MLVITGTKIMVVKVEIMKILAEVMDLILVAMGKEMIIEGEAGRSRPCRFWGVVDGGGWGYGSPRKEKRIWSWRGERRFWAGR